MSTDKPITRSEVPKKIIQIAPIIHTIRHRQCSSYSQAHFFAFCCVGTPEQIADLIEDWFVNDAADGFNIMPPLLLAMLDVFSAEVIPLLQRRGLFRTSYEGRTLREHYGLPRPESAFDPRWVERSTAR